MTAEAGDSGSMEAKARNGLRIGMRERTDGEWVWTVARTGVSALRPAEDEEEEEEEDDDDDDEEEESGSGSAVESATTRPWRQTVPFAWKTRKDASS